MSARTLVLARRMEMIEQYARGLVHGVVRAHPRGVAALAGCALVVRLIADGTYVFEFPEVPRLIERLVRAGHAGLASALERTAGRGRGLEEPRRDEGDRKVRPDPVRSYRPALPSSRGRCAVAALLHHEESGAVAVVTIAVPTIVQISAPSVPVAN
jgi:hypothetical protein